MSKVKYAIGITLFESKKFGGPKICDGAICPTERANKICCGVIEVMEKMTDVKIIGQMDNTIDHTFESANRVYDIGGVAPTMNTCGGGGLQPKIIETKCVGGLGEKKSNNGTQYYQQERVYQMGEYSLCLPANLPGGSYNYITDEKVCVAMRGRNPTNQSDRTPGIELEQTLEANTNGTSNCLTSVQKDNLLLENIIQKPRGFNNGSVHEICTPITSSGWQENNFLHNQYRIRKLTPKECWRLMDFSDEDFEKAEKVNSNTQLYKQAGNSIVVNVLVAILGQLLQGKEDLYKEII